MRRRISKSQIQRLLSRRDFLAIAGLATGAGAAICGASTIGLYWLLSGNRRPASTLDYSTTTPDPRLVMVDKVMASPEIISRDTWGARPINLLAKNESGLYSEDNPEGWRVYDGDLRDDYQTIVLHHSAVYEIDDVATMRYVQDLHMDDRGWADVGYHFCVGKTGLIFEGREMAVRGTHTASYNTGSLGVCLLGNFEDESPTDAQLAATLAVVQWLALRLELTHLAGHREFNDVTVCPGENFYPLLDDIAVATGLIRGTDGYIGPAPSEDDVTAMTCCCCGAT